MPPVEPQAEQLQNRDWLSASGTKKSALGAEKRLGQINIENEEGVSKYGGNTAFGGRQADAGENVERTPPNEKIWNAYPGEYRPPFGCAHPEISGLFQHPSTFIDNVNPGGPGVPGRANNCGECARAVERNWRGEPQVAAALTGPKQPGEPPPPGEPPHRMEEWIGSTARSMDYAEIHNLLTEAGEGSSAVIGQFWKEEDGGHWFNAVNKSGHILVVDGQSGIIEDWPPSKDGAGWDESIVANSIAIVRDRNGRVIT